MTLGCEIRVFLKGVEDQSNQSIEAAPVIGVSGIVNDFGGKINRRVIIIQMRF